MLNLLDDALRIALDRVDDLDQWESLIVNKRKPYTYRIFTEWDAYRICLHKFDPCMQSESLLHPHGWPSAMVILDGKYLMQVGYSLARLSPPSEVCQIEVSKGCRYEMTNPLCWHSVTPLVECHTLMINGSPWSSEVCHKDVRTTKGKGLESMVQSDLEAALSKFKNLIQHELR